MRPRVSVVTLTFNRPAALRRCLESLACQTLDHAEFEVVLVDVSDQPADWIVDAFRNRLAIRHLQAANKGVAANRNRGARQARGSWLAFLDDDCVAAPGWLEALMRRADSHPDTIIGGVVRNLRPDNTVACAGQVITEAVDACFNPPGEQATFFPGLNFSVPKEAYLALDGNDERFGRLAAEDRDFISRWRASGRRLVKADDAVVTHEHRADLPGFVRQYFNYGRGAWRYHRLARGRGEITIVDMTRLHRGIWRYAGKPLRRLPMRPRVAVTALLLVWELANASGFAWQAGQEFIARNFRGAAT
jgi:glycosyltransferase involved in cell wall biosynthesis